MSELTLSVYNLNEVKSNEATYARDFLAATTDLA